MSEVLEQAGDGRISDERPLAEIQRLARIATAGLVPDTIRRCRRLAASVGATGFVLFFSGRGVGAARLVSCFDESCPGSSATTTALLARCGDALSQHAARSALPATWGTIDPLQANTFVVPFEHPMADRAGLVLPVAAESGQTGLFVFTGRALQLDMPRLRDLHRDCYAAFEAIAALKSGSSSSATAISKRELECLRLTAAGRTSEDIARILGLSIHTANQYLTSAAAKLDAVNRMQAVAKAMRLGMID